MKKQKLIFVIYGRDERIYQFLKLFVEKNSTAKVISLKEIGPMGLLSIRSRIRYCLDRADFCIALASQDDVGYLKTEPQNSENRCRQNVLFELGSALVALDNEHCSVIRHSSVVLPSDLGDITYITYNDFGENALSDELKKLFEYWNILKN